ncbi:hypothetical protein QTI51_24695 [Variovorax sp. J22G73]|uniref:hypothetical protein n=1 Tax=unclassified Variovorax TaxID=663243 RepID=UPI002575F031|nr:MULTISPECIES: hypothetical protein [unclassified Variovorax]MDM0007878.1 hypothetical protein [Variovorax sp. J22R203]MDM0100499.1 hypothetical protein [Variovorax sp. J22G73]
MATAIIRRSGDRPHLALVASKQPSQQDAAASTRTRRAWRDRRPLEREEWHWANAYTGTAEALVAAGICRMDQLPGQPGNKKTSCTYYRGQPCGRTAFNGAQRDAYFMTISAEGKTRFRVVKGLPVEEQDRRSLALREAEKARTEANNKLEYEAAAARLAQRKRESTADVLRDQLQGYAGGLRRALDSCQQGQELFHDWRLSENDLQRVLLQVEALEHAVRGVTPIRYESRTVSRLVAVKL